MELHIKSLIGEATAYDKKQMLEIRRPKSWLKSVSTFANGEGEILIFGISDDEVVGLTNAKSDAERISEEIEIKQLNPLTVPSKRRNPLLADFFSRLGLMERRGSGMKKIIDSYKKFEKLPNFHIPEFQSNASEFHVVLWNLNFENKIIGKNTLDSTPLLQEFVKGPSQFAKEFVKGPSQFTKEFVKASRQIYKLISKNPKISAVQMSESMGLSPRQVQKYLKRLQELGKITRIGGRKMGEWKIVDEEYEGFFDKI